MAYGIRIRHNKARAGLFPVPLPHKPLLDNKVECGACRRATGKKIVHNCKMVHLVLDDEGCAIVSRSIWDDFQRVANNAGFVPANLVLEPPTQTASPATVKLEIDGIGFGVEKAKVQYSTGSGAMTRPVDAPHVMDMDTYVDKCARLGIGKDQALNALLVAALKGKGQ